MIHSKPGTTTTIIMVRHAERTATGNQLTKLDQQNARALVDEIGSMNISAIYSPNLTRNLDTVRPLARHLGINITKVSDDPNEQDIVIDIMNRYAGETVLWVGNTTNLPGIYSSLGGTGEHRSNMVIFISSLCRTKVTVQLPKNAGVNVNNPIGQSNLLSAQIQTGR